MASQKDYLISYHTSEKSVHSLRVKTGSVKTARAEGTKLMEEAIGKPVDPSKVEVTVIE